MQVHTFIDATEGRRLSFAIYGSIVVAVLFAAISLGGLLIPSAYARETSNWIVQAIAQDWFDLVVAAPAILAAAIWVSRGSRRGQLVLAGFLLYTVYTLVIYAFAVHLNVLFLVYCAGLGVALYTLIAVGRALGSVDARSWFDERLPRRAVSIYLIVVGLAFAALWLRQLVPAALTGEVPSELADTGLFTNPIHVLDLSFILPLHIVAGVLLWRRRSLGSVLAPVVLAFDVLMSASIAFLVVMMELRGVASGTWSVAVAMAVVCLVGLTLLVAMLRTLRASENGQQD